MKNTITIRDVLYAGSPTFEDRRFFNFAFKPHNPCCYGSSNTLGVEDYVYPIYNSHSVTAMGADALTHREFAFMPFKEQLPEVLTACIIDGEPGVAQALLTQAPVQEVSYFAELIQLICVNRGVAYDGQN